MKHFIILVLLLTGLNVYPQDQPVNYGIRFSGFVKNDIFFDTRQSSAANGIREGHFFLYPDNVLEDNMGNDINDAASFHMLSIQSRIRGDITAPDAFGAKTSGAIEAEFFGTSDADINGFRLRHAYVKLDWAKVSLLAGQYWHPLFPSESFPGTVSFNTGAPFVPFSRNPQVKVTLKAGSSSFAFTAYSQRDFASSGPDGASNKYLRNSGLPGMNLNLKIPAGKFLTAWAGADYKILKPQLRTTTNWETNEKVGSFVLYGNLKIKTTPVTATFMGIYAQNSSDLMMIGGYCVSEITDVVRQYREYTPLNTTSYWVDLTTNGSKVSTGIFAGYSKNLGAGEDIVTNSVYGRGNNIDHLFRVSPRITFTSEKLSIAAEIEHTAAAYGTIGQQGLAENSETVANTRILLSTIFRF